VAANPQPNLSEAVDDYLKAILELGGVENTQVTTNALAAHLSVRTPSVTGMLQKLSTQTPPLVQYEKHHGVRLTQAGKRRAWELVRHHRLLELFLHGVLKYSWDEVHEEAERLEHFISERFEDRVAAILGHPEIDPHGHRIPRKHQAGSFPDELPLTEWPLRKPAKITSVSDRNPDILRQLERLGLRPGVTISVEQRPSSASLSVRFKNRPALLRLTREIGDSVFAARETLLSRERQ
jgi:DtxR family Mn-dependent transcriptional regulator